MLDVKKMSDNQILDEMDKILDCIGDTSIIPSWERDNLVGEELSEYDMLYDEAEKRCLI